MDDDIDGGVNGGAGSDGDADGEWCWWLAVLNVNLGRKKMGVMIWVRGVSWLMTWNKKCELALYVSQISRVQMTHK